MAAKTKLLSDFVAGRLAEPTGDTRPPRSQRATEARKHGGTPKTTPKETAPEARAEPFPRRVTLDLTAETHRQLRNASTDFVLPSSAILRALLAAYVEDENLRTRVNEHARAEVAALRSKKPEVR